MTESSLQTDVIERPQAIAVVAVATRPNASLGRLMGEEIERPNKNGKPGVWVLVLLGVFLIAAITYRRGGSLTG